MSNLGTTDYLFRIAQGLVDGYSSINKFGENHDIDSGTTPEDIWSGGGVYTPPTANRTHQVRSDSASDAGTLVGTYASTTYNIEKLIDSGATFITDGVAVGDVIVNDTNQDHSIVITVDSETQLTIEPWHHEDEDNVGDTFRIATSAGTGAVFIHIKQGYQKDGTENTEFILMNGVTNVPTINTYYRITRAHIHGVGSNDSNTGNISIVADTDNTTTAYIELDHGQTQMAFIHVPYGKTAYITNYYITVFRGTKIANAMVQIEMQSQLWGNDGIVVEHSAGVGATGGNFNKLFSPFKRVSQGTDLWLRCTDCTDDNTEVSAGFDLILVDN